MTQDPLDNTIEDFWRMVVEQNVITIVMLSENGEGQSRCPCYWPTNEPFVHETLKVCLNSEDNHNQHFILRNFTVTKVGKLT